MYELEEKKAPEDAQIQLKSNSLNWKLPYHGEYIN
jgi:hypothetical protein